MKYLSVIRQIISANNSSKLVAKRIINQQEFSNLRNLATLVCSIQRSFLYLLVVEIVCSV